MTQTAIKNPAPWLEEGRRLTIQRKTEDERKARQDMLRRREANTKRVGEWAAFVTGMGVSIHSHHGGVFFGCDDDVARLTVDGVTFVVDGAYSALKVERECRACGRAVVFDTGASTFAPANREWALMAISAWLDEPANPIGTYHDCGQWEGDRNYDSGRAES